MPFVEPGVVAPAVRFFAGIDGGGTPLIVALAVVELSPDIENHLGVIRHFYIRTKQRWAYPSVSQ